MATSVPEPSTSTRASSVVAAILAGGRGKRFGGVAKAALRLADRSLLDWVATTLVGQASTTLLSIASDYTADAWVKVANLPVVTDEIADRGPLAAVASLLAWTQLHLPQATMIVTVPVDAPFVPTDLIARLTEAGTLSIAESGSRRHYAIAAWPVGLATEVAAAVDDGETALHRFQEARAVRSVHWHTAPFDPFFNINTPEDLRAAERIAVLAAERAPRRFA